MQIDVYGIPNPVPGEITEFNTGCSQPRYTANGPSSPDGTYGSHVKSTILFIPSCWPVKSLEPYLKKS